MAIVEKVEHEDLVLYEVFRNPVLFGEFVNNYDKLDHEEPFAFDWYQAEILMDFSQYVSIMGGRAIGKCLDKNTKLLDTVTGEYNTVENFYKNGINSLTNISYSTLKQDTEVPKIEYNGIKPVLTITAEKGYKTTVTYEHPFLTNYGWKKAEELKENDFIAVPDKLEYFGNYYIPDDDIIYISHFIAEGSYNVGSVTTTEPEVISELHEFANNHNMGIRKDDITYCFSGEYRLRLLEKYGLRYCHSYDKFVPQDIFRLPRKSIALFLNRLFSDDGWCYYKGNGNYDIGYATTSETLARDIKHLLLRFGIIASLSYKGNKKLGAWQLSIKGIENCSKFEEIGFFVKRKQDALLQILLNKKNNNNTSSANIVPVPNYRKYRIKNLYKKGNSTRHLRYYPTREKITEILNPDAELARFVNSDVSWVKVNSVVASGESETYSIEMSKNHTLVADDIYSHNTVSLSNLLVWLLINNVFSNDYLVYTVPGRAHLEPVFTALVRLLRTNTILKYFISQSSGINASDYTIKLLNQAQLLCRIAGQSNTGVAVIGLHSPLEILDESGYYPYNTFTEFRPTLNTWTSGRRLIVAGVPTGVRERNVCYHCDMENSDFSKHRISALQNPRFTEDDKRRAIEQYGGEESDDYIHLVLGQHGRPVFALFDRTMMEISDYPVYKLQIDGTKMLENVAGYIEKASVLPAVPSKKFHTFFGIDLGYTEPTAIFIFYIDDYGRVKIHARIQLNKVSYPIQEKFIDYLDSKYTPAFIGMDEGNAGKAVRQHLLEDTQYIHKEYPKRIVSVDFSSSIVIGIDNDGKEIKSKTKPFATSVLQDYANNHKVIFSSTDLEIITELERMTYTKTPTGEIVYRTLTERGGKKGEDHFTSALLCGVMAYYVMNSFLQAKQIKKTLAIGGWFRG